MLACVTTALAATAAPPSVSLTRIAGQQLRPGYSEAVRLKQTVKIFAAVSNPPRNRHLELQGRLTGRWQTLRAVSFDSDRFSLRWHVRTRESELRAVLVSNGRVVAVSPTYPILVGSAIVPCRGPVVNFMIPATDGLLEGGVYLMGGPAPGLDECQSDPSTLTITSPTFTTTDDLSGGDGYAVGLPPGSYTLTDGQCRGTATITAGKTTHANTDCDFP